MSKTLIYALTGWFAGLLVGVGAVSLLRSNGIHIGMAGGLLVVFVPSLLGMEAVFVLGDR